MRQSRCRCNRASRDVDLYHDSVTVSRADTFKRCLNFSEGKCLESSSSSRWQSCFGNLCSLPAYTHWTKKVTELKKSYLLKIVMFCVMLTAVLLTVGKLLFICTLQEPFAWCWNLSTLVKMHLPNVKTLPNVDSRQSNCLVSTSEKCACPVLALDNWLV